MNFKAIGRALTDGVFATLACAFLYLGWRLWQAPQLIGDFGDILALSLLLLLLPPLIMGWGLGARVNARPLPHAVIAVFALNATFVAISWLIDLPFPAPDVATSWTRALKSAGITLLVMLIEVSLCVLAIKVRGKVRRDMVDHSTGHAS